MFGNHSSSGSIGTLTVLAAVALGALLTPLNCTVAQARPTDLSLGLKNEPFALLQETGSGATAVATTAGNARHPTWVTDPESKKWSGFLTGLPGYEDFVMPVGMPMYFADPFITTDLRLLYIHHQIPGGSALGSGEVHVAAVQIRVALSERMAFMVTKGGYSRVDSRATPAADGPNDWALGLKYALYSNPDDQFLVPAGLRWDLSSGSTDAWQREDSQEPSMPSQ